MSNSLCDLTEIIPGYTCTERIGAGGYGEVWKVDAPGGLKKAMKIVYGFVGEERAERERKALERIKGLRHPYMLSLERVEILQHRLLIVSELADGSLMDRFQACRHAGLPGIPRDELIRYLGEAAEALDFLLHKHGLQHLDIKPENLLLLCEHAKVADFGLVKDLFDQSHSLVSGLTPVYAAPETFHGTASRWSDQYSLAVVYQQMLTGTLPYPGRHAAQLVAQQARLKPELGPLPEQDRPAVARALQKSPESRFDSCSAFVRALTGQEGPPTIARCGPPLPISVEPRAPADEETRSTKGILTDVVGARQARPEERTLTQKLGHQDVPVDSGSWTTDGEELAPVVVVSSAIRRIPPLHLALPPNPLTPAVIIGIGGTGVRVTARLRTLCQQAMTPDDLAAIQFLVMDTDTRWLRDMACPGDPASLAPADALMLPLRRPEEFLRESDQYLAWLSRRWLYNIRPSLVTNGLRPLGRLAWFDHRERVQQALTARLVPGTSSAAPPASKGHTAAARTRPHVFLVGSISGGTGGMILDVARAASDTLRRAGFPDARIDGLLVHSTTPQPQQRELANANAFATLNELRHLVCHGETLQSRFTPRAPSKPARAWDPFQSIYYLPLGQDLDESTFTTHLHELADYLCRNLTTPLGGFLDRVRRQSASARHHDLWLRSFRFRPIDGKTGGNDAKNLTAQLQQSKLPLGRCGYQLRSLVLLPAEFPLPPSDPLNHTAEVLRSPGLHEVLACWEAEKLSLVQAARSLCQEGIDVEDAAQRLHSRRDITWSDMPREQGADPVPTSRDG